MSDIMKLADDYASACADVREFLGANAGMDEADGTWIASQQARAALQSAIEALQSECAEHKENAMRNARQAVAFRAERDALQAKLDAMGKGEPVPEWYLPRITEVRTRLASLSSAMRPDDSLGMVLGNLSGQLASCERVALRYAAPKALAPLEDYDARHLLSLVPHYFGDTGDMYGMRVLRAMEQFHGIGGTP